jgi:hypothetical protein
LEAKAQESEVCSLLEITPTSITTMGDRMRFCYFEVEKIGSPFRDQKPPFSRCTAKLGIADDGDEAVHQISLDIVFRENAGDSLETVRTKILAECIRLMQEGARSLEGNTLEALYEKADVEHERAIGAL